MDILMEGNFMAHELEKQKNKFTAIIIDSDEDLLELMVYEFKLYGFTVDHFTTGRDALVYFSNNEHMPPPHLLIIDRQLPDMDGLNLIKELSKKYDKEMPLVVILSLLFTDKESLEELGLKDVRYEPKPFNLEAFVKKYKSVLSNRYGII